MDDAGAVNQGERATAVQKMCQYICGCFSCLQRPDEAEGELVQERHAQMVEEDMGAYQGVPGQHRTPNHAFNKRSQKQQQKLTYASRVPLSTTEADGPNGEHLIQPTADPILIADGRNLRNDLEAGEKKKDKQKIPRIYDVDESMSL